MILILLIQESAGRNFTSNLIHIHEVCVQEVILAVFKWRYRSFFLSFTQAHEKFEYKALPQIQAVVTEIPKQKPAKHSKNKRVKYSSAAKLNSKLKALEKSSPMTDITEQMMGEGGPLAIIEPKVLDFVVTDADKENSTCILLTNNTQEMELFKVRVLVVLLLSITVPALSYSIDWCYRDNSKIHNFHSKF